MACKTLIAALAALALASGAARAAADPPAPVAAVTPAGQALTARQAHFREQNAVFKAINDELKKDAPDKAAIAAGATRLKTSAAALPTWFPKGSGPETGLKTAARAEIWTDAAGFAAVATQFQTETDKLEQVAVTGDLEATKAQDRAVGAACGACHTKYRAAAQP
jgi:cytochrome c556